MIEQVRADKVKTPRKFEHVVKCLEDFRMETPWEKLDPSLRSFIGTLWGAKKYPGRSTMIITQNIARVHTRPGAITSCARSLARAVSGRLLLSHPGLRHPFQDLFHPLRLRHPTWRCSTGKHLRAWHSYW